MSIAAGTKLGRYEIRSKIGAGGMGEVYLAQDTKLDRKVALKILPAEVAAMQERMRRFVQEAKAASALNHPNIITIYEIEETESVNFIATEFIDGRTLREKLRGRMDLVEALDVAQQTAFALTAAHGAGILHRDIKPENIMVRHDGIVKVLDFGLAKLLEDKQRELIDAEANTLALVLTNPGTVLGTPQYMSPAQARGLDLDARTDIWSLGVVLYEMVAGRVPFRGETNSHTVVAILETEPPPLATFAPNTPAELQRIVRKALSKDSDSRYQTARDLMIDLKSLRRDLDLKSEIERSSAPLTGQRTTGSAAVSEPPPPPPPTTSLQSIGDPPERSALHTRSSNEFLGGTINRHKRAITIAVILVLCAVAGVGYWLFGRHSVRAIPIGSIAVLPFVNATGNSEVEYLSEGMTESLITSLSQLPNLSVKARSSVFRYKGKDASPQQVGRDLNVQAIVNGRVMQHGNELTLHIELVDVNAETALWSGDYKRSMSDLVSLPSEIASDVSNKLQLRLSGADQKKLAKNYTANTEAYDLYLKGRFHWNKRTSAEIRQAIDYFSRAIAIDPSYALAYTGLADCYNLQGLREIAPDEAFPKAKAAALKALEIDDSLAEAHNSLGFIKHRYEWDWQGAEREFRRALELNPNYATAHQWYAFYFASQGQSAESIAEIKRALELDPLSLEINADVGVQYMYARQTDQAVEALRKAVGLDENFAYSHSMLSRAYLMKGLYPEAIKEAQKAADLGGRSSRLISTLGQAQAAAGRQADARKTLEELSNLSTQSYVSPLELAVIHAGLNEKEKAIAEMQQGYAGHATSMAFLKVDFRFDSFRSDQRFADIVRRVGL